ncbi:MAG TPA: stereocilin [Ramlibacter sp.]|uniref:stereocilin n=1 Tax=Ramlibacter sp. TaxID=1917967 RepID=UPI002CED0E7B|nr:stereocilin [Ramlibacter sp.]HVZ46622.1 stereocilin [Ramlibacter sp.]
MATHPVEPEPVAPDERGSEAPNPSHLPVEPEFGPMTPPGRPEEPRAPKPSTD